MKCPNDQTEMEKGYTDGTVWFGGKWMKISLFPPLIAGDRVFAWKCPKCGKIELYWNKKTDVKK